MSITEMDIRPDMEHTERVPRDEMVLKLTGGAKMLSLARTSVIEFARCMAFSPQQLDDIKLAVGEAVANALRHGRSRDGDWVEIKATRRGNALRVAVEDGGCGFSPALVCHTLPASMNEGGRGIVMMRALMDRVTFSQGPVGTCVVMFKLARQFPETADR